MQWVADADSRWISVSGQVSHDGTTLDIGPAGGHIPQACLPIAGPEGERGEGVDMRQRDRYITGEMGEGQKERGRGRPRGGERQVGEKQKEMRKLAVRQRHQESEGDTKRRRTVREG